MSETKPNAKYDHGFAIIRLDMFHGPMVPSASSVYVTKVLWTQHEAEVETDRLNSLSAGKDYTYAWQITRVSRRKPQSTETTGLGSTDTPASEVAEDDLIG